jgi:hypothetical protein
MSYKEISGMSYEEVEAGDIWRTKNNSIVLLVLQKSLEEFDGYRMCFVTAQILHSKYPNIQGIRNNMNLSTFIRDQWEKAA